MDMSHDEFHSEIRILLESNDKGKAVMKIQEYLDEHENAPLNIGITGESGSGKSTFVNAFRGVDNKDECAAPTGCVETTMKATQYKHPKYPNVTLWDLPGIGTANFTSDKYLEDVGFERFDFFIIISDTRFRENDVKLAKEIKKMGKRFYFVRSKIDDALRAEQRSQREFSEEKTLTRIRENCVQGLQQQGIESPDVFLVSGFDLGQYDFSVLSNTLEKELPEQKRHALLIATPNVNQKIIMRKKKALEKEIKNVAAASAVGGSLPVSGLSIAIDAALLVSAVTYYVHAFDLDLPSLRKLSESSGVSLQKLLDVIVSPVAATEITTEILMKMTSQHTATTVLLAVEEICRFIPIIGIPASMTLSFGTTYRILKMFLDMLADDAHNVFKVALASRTE